MNRSQVYSGTEYNKLKHGPDGKYVKTIIKLTNQSGIHRGCDYNLPPSGEPKRVDDPVPWGTGMCEEGGIHAVLGEERVAEWLKYSYIGEMKRAFLVQVPDDETVKVVEFSSKIKMSSIIICKELDFDEVVRKSRELKLEEERKHKTEEEERNLRLAEERRLSRNRRLASILNLENMVGMSLKTSTVSDEDICKAMEAIKEYGSVDRVPLHDQRLRFVPCSGERKEFWYVHGEIMGYLNWFYTTNRTRNVGQGNLYATFRFSNDLLVLIKKHRASLDLAGPFGSLALDYALSQNWGKLMYELSSIWNRF